MTSECKYIGNSINALRTSMVDYCRSVIAGGIFSYNILLSILFFWEVNHSKDFAEWVAKVNAERYLLTITTEIVSALFWGL